MNGATELSHLEKSIHTASTCYNKILITQKQYQKKASVCFLFFPNKNYLELPHTFVFFITLPIESLDPFDKHIFNVLLRMMQ